MRGVWGRVQLTYTHTLLQAHERGAWPQVDEDVLRQVFLRAGEVTNAAVMRENGRSRGFGFVNFARPDGAARAVAQLDGHAHAGGLWQACSLQIFGDRCSF